MSPNLFTDLTIFSLSFTPRNLGHDCCVLCCFYWSL